MRNFSKGVESVMGGILSEASYHFSTHGPSFLAFNGLNLFLRLRGW
jgi:hypothetical protein